MLPEREGIGLTSEHEGPCPLIVRIRAISELCVVRWMKGNPGFIQLQRLAANERTFYPLLTDTENSSASIDGDSIGNVIHTSGSTSSNGGEEGPEARTGLGADDVCMQGESAPLDIESVDSRGSICLGSSVTLIAGRGVRMMMSGDVDAESGS